MKARAKQMMERELSALITAFRQRQQREPNTEELASLHEAALENAQ